MGASAQRWVVVHSHATITSPGSAPDSVCRRQFSDGWRGLCDQSAAGSGVKAGCVGTLHAVALRRRWPRAAAL